MFPSSLRLLSSIALVLFVGCSSEGNTTVNDAGTTEGGTGAVTPKNAYWCGTVDPAGCTQVNVCGTCVANPPGELTRTTDTDEYKGTGAPDVSCFDAAKPPPPKGTSKNVTMKGYVKIFANGPDSKNVKIDVYEELLDAAGMPTGRLGTLVGTGFSDETLTDVQPNPKIETITKSGVDSDRRLYAYKITGTIPTEKPLVVRTTGKTEADGWFPLYDYNVVAVNTELTNDEFIFDIRALGNDDYASILKAAYNRPPEGGQSAIAGEVHDCGDVRVSNATVQINPKSPLGLFYLSEVEDDPLPESGRKATGRLGLYAVGGLKPGVFDIAAAGRIGAETVALGAYKIEAFADSVSVYTFRGIRSWQVKK